MKERPLVTFTILAQMAAGLAWWLCVLHSAAPLWATPSSAARLMAVGWSAIALFMVAALTASFAHLGVPQNAWRAAHNWRSSWLSREILAASAFTGAALLVVALRLWIAPAAALTQGVICVSALLGGALIYSMAHAYRLPTVPAWHTRVTSPSFFLTALQLGSGSAAIALIFSSTPGAAAPGPLQWVILAVIGFTAGNLGLTVAWIATLATGSATAARAAAAITQGQRLLFRTRVVLMALSLLCAALSLPALSTGITAARPWVILTFGLVLVSEALGRSLFYAGQVKHDVYLYSG